MERADFWSDPKNAQSVGQERVRLEEKVSYWKRLESETSDLNV
jgi:hypothetical protein